MIIADSYAMRTVKWCVRCSKRRLTTPTNIGPLCNDCLTKGAEADE
jgi:hypothetical protein